MKCECCGTEIIKETEERLAHYGMEIIDSKRGGWLLWYDLWTDTSAWNKHEDN